jgi:hypothetical protein
MNQLRVNGVPREIRTPDLLIRSQTLYPAELWAHNGADDEIRTRDPRLGKAMLYH